ncbi:CBS domain-containing protein [Desulfoscipio sp. XC116]|uniref:CBS domain-containing protein n=1 Tax=Desulfoscipio sp. XC116 TaxID=3144975 RepID=UPI00325BF277
MTTKKIAMDIMVPVSDYSAVHTTDTLAQAIKVLKDSFTMVNRVINGHRSVLVLDDSEHLVGIVTIRSILKSLEIKSQIGSSLARIFVRDIIENNAMTINVMEVMRPVKENYVKATDNITVAAKAILTGRINIVPVVHENQVVGIIRSIDLFNVIGELLD